MAGDEQVDHAEPVAVGSFGTAGEAEVAQALLSGYGVDAMVIDAIEGGAIPIEGEPGVALLVRAADADEAAAILAAAPGDPGDTGDPGDPDVATPPVPTD